MAKNRKWFVEDGEEPNREAFPQRPANYEDRYEDTPDFGGVPDCPECGATMGYSYMKSEYKCPECGFKGGWGEIKALGGFDNEDEPDEEEMPFVCRTCGGPWPDCRTSCKMFDD